MAPHDPPWRLDPFKNIKRVSWGGSKWAIISFAARGFGIEHTTIHGAVPNGYIYYNTPTQDLTPVSGYLSVYEAPNAGVEPIELTPYYNFAGFTPLGSPLAGALYQHQGYFPFAPGLNPFDLDGEYPYDASRDNGGFAITKELIENPKKWFGGGHLYQPPFLEFQEFGLVPMVIHFVKLPAATVQDPTFRLTVRAHVVEDTATTWRFSVSTARGSKLLDQFMAWPNVSGGVGPELPELTDLVANVELEGAPAGLGTTIVRNFDINLATLAIAP